MNLLPMSPRTRRNGVVALLVPFVAGWSGCANQAASESASIVRLDGTGAPLEEIESEIEMVLEGARLPGLQVAVIRDGQIAYSEGFGVREAGASDAVTRNTVFAANSFSKTMFAYVVLQLVDEGVIELDRPMASYLPRPLADYEFYTDLADEARADALTPRMALSHTTGFPNWRWFTPEGRLQFIYEPGSRHGYSGEGIALLQLVVEEVTGVGLEELARRRIFEPFGMERTSFVFLPEFEADHATDHDTYLQPIGKQRREEANAAGSAQTTVDDYARFLIAVMAGEGLSPETREEMFSPQVEIEHARMFGPLTRVAAPADGPEIAWGLGWGLVESDHGRAFFHTGNDRGSANYHVGFLEPGVAVVLFGNSQTVERAAPALTRLLIGDTFSPFEFLGYEPYGSVRGRLGDVVAADGFEAGLAFRATVSDDEARRWYPEEWALLDAVGQDLVGMGHVAEAVDLYRYFTSEHAGQIFGNDRLGSALAASGQYDDASSAYRAGLELSGDDSFWSALYGWKLAWAEALAEPREVAESVLEDYAGVYETRHVDLRDGALYYYREGTADEIPKRLTALDERTFVFETNDSFRLRFDRDETGAVFRITGQYQDDEDDQTLRNP